MTNFTSVKKFMETFGQEVKVKNQLFHLKKYQN